jgi:hypothetical protein
MGKNVLLGKRELYHFVARRHQQLVVVVEGHSKRRFVNFGDGEDSAGVENLNP